MFPGIALLLIFCSLSVYMRQNCPIGIDECNLSSNNVSQENALEFCVEIFEVSFPNESVIHYHSHLDYHWHEDKEWRITVNQGYAIELMFLTIEVICDYCVKCLI